MTGVALEQAWMRLREIDIGGAYRSPQRSGRVHSRVSCTSRPPSVAREEPMLAKFDDQVAHFLSTFPGGFADPLYLFQEREFASSRGEPRYKTRAVRRAQELLEESALDAIIADGGAGFYRAVRDIAGSVTNLLSRFEAARLSDQMKDADAELGVARGLRALLYGTNPLATRFDAFAAAWRPDCASSWTILTLLPAFAKPSEFVFVKPTYWRRQATIIGRSVAQSAPLGKRYEDFLATALDVRKRLADQSYLLEAADLLDVYSFTFRTLAKSKDAGSVPDPVRSYGIVRTRGLLLLPKGEALEPGEHSGVRWRRWTRDGTAREIHITAQAGAVVHDDAGATILTVGGADAGPAWWSWPRLERVGRAPDVAFDALATGRTALVDAAPAGGGLVWIPAGNDGTPESHVATASGLRAVDVRGAAERIEVRTGGPVRLVVNRAGTYAALAHLGSGITIIDLLRKKAREIFVPASGHPLWGCIHPELPLAVAFDRGVHLVDFSKANPVVRTFMHHQSAKKLGGEFTPDGKWLVYADDRRVYGLAVGGNDIRTLTTRTVGPEDEPLRISPEGDIVLLARGNGVEGYELGALVRALSTAPVSGKLVRQPDPKGGGAPR